MPPFLLKGVGECLFCVESHDGLVLLLLARSLLRLFNLLAILVNLLEGQLAILKVLADTAVEAGITSLLHGGQLRVLKDVGSVHECACHSIHTADVSDEEVLEVGRVTTDLGVEVGTTIAKSTIADDLHHRLCQFPVR